MTNLRRKLKNRITISVIHNQLINGKLHSGILMEQIRIITKQMPGPPEIASMQHTPKIALKEEHH